MKEAPSFVLIFGESNTALATSLIARELNIPSIQLDAGAKKF